MLRSAAPFDHFRHIASCEGQIPGQSGRIESRLWTTGKPTYVLSDSRYNFSFNDADRASDHA
ncbi:hypothetical protein [Afipia sp. P52-10]|jgi:hypothetical protein|uniref:hypothetical protein n=1 Tax=Afipia sp. P52-10 TaxID=1429916 RepID=UPI0004AF1BA5|nr:hypothetical protein [Afipia sp. P52-10]